MSLPPLPTMRKAVAAVLAAAVAYLLAQVATGRPIPTTGGGWLSLAGAALAAGVAVYATPNATPDATPTATAAPSSPPAPNPSLCDCESCRYGAPAGAELVAQAADPVCDACGGPCRFPVVPLVARQGGSDHVLLVEVEVALDAAQVGTSMPPRKGGAW